MPFVIPSDDRVVSGAERGHVHGSVLAARDRLLTVIWRPHAEDVEVRHAGVSGPVLSWYGQ